ncbi:hypothetical protein DSL64_24655 [Dyadobacter luteus]|jgi:hypothetical protein|uniref:Secretion system C-terminal sorting domain-containing protein n=1 Tax=Dyadobacter luteus TaxID=2259619 RepID=A0A3D8Y4E8_9BACT|nr:hypothetical protein [Dyadobacter luteus]REA57151.1 hypothetical protein DSL64_24655 [Dyadobacter luteus]
MKTSVKYLALVFAFVATAFTANAEDKETKKSAGFGTGIYATTKGTIRVLVEKVNTEANTTIYLRNEKGNIIYRETVGKNLQQFGRTLNVDDLSAGKYQIEVICNGEKQSKSFELAAPKMERTLLVK